jgi:hypothetical protein
VGGWNHRPAAGLRFCLCVVGGASAGKRLGMLSLEVAPDDVTGARGKEE